MALPLLRNSLPLSPASARGMATLKDIETRLKSVKNIKKITSSMKMVSAAKFSRSERALKPARAYGIGANALYEKNEINMEGDKEVVVALSSDRGLCGGIHSSISKAIKAHTAGNAPQIVIVGDKVKAQLQKLYSQQFVATFNGAGKNPAKFEDASNVASEVLALDYDKVSVFYNKFVNVVSYKTDNLPVPSLGAIEATDSILVYDEVDSEVLRSYQEFTLANIIHAALKEQEASEQSARMNAMENATRNAGEMIDSLTLQYNRTRQAVITRELIEIISGANALD